MLIRRLAETKNNDIAFFLDAKERYSITEACLEKYERNFENSSQGSKGI